MKRILLLCLTAVFALVIGELRAQERTVTGRITSEEDGSTLPGVNVVLKGTTLGTVTNAEGVYSISVPASGGTLVFTFIGLQTQEVEVGSRETVDVQMTQDVAQLSEVVVTGLNIARDAKTLPYAAQQVTSEKLNMTRANNINDALSGKVAGLQIRGQSGAALGRNSSIRIRGAGSLNDKEPLYVVDGTPVTNSNDFNPDDVESISVLKGPAATAVYGQRGDAGVVMVTLKKGTKGKGMGINISHNTFFDKLYIMPRHQNSYAGGAVGELQTFVWQDGMPEEWKSLDGKFYHDYTDDASWGPRMNGQEYIPWYSWLPGTKYTGTTARLNPQPDNVRDFFDTGVNKTTNVSFSKALDHGSIRASYTRQDQSGILPNTSLDKNTFALGTSLDLSKWVTIGANINYVNTIINGEFDDAYSNQSTGSFNQWFHRNIDTGILRELKDAKSPEGRYTSWNHFNPSTYNALDDSGVKYGDRFYRGYYWYNPYTYFEQIDYKTTRNRLFGDVNITFNITDKIKAQGFYRKNQNTQFYENKRPSSLPYSFYTENRPTSQPQWDFYGTGQSTFKEDNMEFLLSYNDRFLDDKLSVDVYLGGNIRKEEVSELNMNTVDGLVVPDLFTISNSKSTFQYSNPRAKKQVNSIYARGNFGYNETFFLDWSVRNDKSSALPESNNSYTYPSLGASFVFSELTEDIIPFLSFGKLRGSWAQTGSDPDPYLVALTYGVGANPWNGNIISSTPDRQVDPNIKPALSSATEVGMDLKFWNNRIGASVTYFSESRVDEILSVGVSGTSGFSSKLINAGQLDRDVLELQFDATPIKTSDIEWNLTFNWAKAQSKIVKLTDDVQAITATTGSSSFGYGITYQVEGKDWGQLRGVSIQRIGGQPVLDANGLYVPTDDPVDFGSVLPDFTGGVINTVTYKNFTLAFNFDFQKGGKFYSLSDQYGTYSGLTERTAGVNDLGNPIRDAVEDGGGVHVFGVNADGEAVDFYVDAQTYYHQYTGKEIIDPHVLDLTFIKLRELSLGYAIPVQKIRPLSRFLNSASVAVVGRNLWLVNGQDRDFDASEISSGFGENGQLPSLRSYGFNIKVGF